MLTIKISSEKLIDSGAQGLVFFARQEQEIEHEQYIEQNYFSGLKQLFKQQKWTGSAGEILVIPVSKNQQLTYIICAGWGKPGSSGFLSIEDYRRTLGSIIRAAESRKISHLALSLPSADLFGVTSEFLAHTTALALRMAAYHFDVYISDQDRKYSQPLEVTFTNVHDTASIQKGIDTGMIIGQAVNQARYWIDLPPSTLTPPELANKALEIARDTGLKITLFNEEEVNKMGMGGLAAVSRGSHQDCCLVILEYATAKKNAPTIAFVGKGITFDSGGLSLKPAASMETMKDDMSGAAAVISAMQAIARLKPDVNVIGVTPLAENLPSGTATKPGDIVRFYNGKTAEIKNTDAEGRLILADALSYAVKHYKLDAIIDIATLTGACRYALGPFFTGMMSVHDELVSRVQKSADQTGDAVWRLPLTNDYKKAIKSTVADLCNVGNSNYYAGVITAACFLQAFVDTTPWVHLDIAGTAFDVPDISYYRPGATGAGVRLLVDIALSWR